MKHIIILILLFTRIGLFAQISPATLIAGKWKNCGAYDLESKIILLFRSVSDTCDAYGVNCAQTKWNFIKSDSVSVVTTEVTCSCKNKILLTCGINQKKLTWTIDEKNRTLTLHFGTKAIRYKINKLTENTIELIKQ